MEIIRFSMYTKILGVYNIIMLFLLRYKINVMNVKNV